MSENFLSFISNVGGKPADASVPENANPSEKTAQGAEFNSILEKERAKTHLEIGDALSYLIHDGGVEVQPSAAALLTNDTKSILLDLDAALTDETWVSDSLKTALDVFLTSKGLKMRDIGPPLRAAVTGMKQSPSIIDIMVALGRIETSARIQAACK